MRQIKFRGKRIDNGEWFYGVPFFIKDEGVAFIINNCQSLSLHDNDTQFDGYNVFPESVGEFTGQIYNDKELFENDIVEIEYHAEIIKEHPMNGFNPFDEDKGKPIIKLVCRYGADSSFHLNRIDDKSYASYSVQFGGSAVKSKKIIGNIYENPELLKP